MELDVCVINQFIFYLKSLFYFISEIDFTTQIANIIIKTDNRFHIQICETMYVTPSVPECENYRGGRTQETSMITRKKLLLFM